MSFVTATSVAAPATAEREVDRHVVRSVGWQLAKVGVQVVQYVVLARLVLPAEFGKFALAVPVLALLKALNDGGLSTAAVTGRNYDEQLASDLYVTQLVLGAVMAGAMALLAPVLAWIYDVPSLHSIGIWLALCLVLNAWSLQPRALLRRQLRIGGLAMVEIAGVVGGLVAALLVARHTTGVAVLVAAQVMNAAITAMVAVTLAPVRLRRFRGRGEFRHAVTIGWHMVGSDVLNALRHQFPALVIGLFVVLSEVGQFNRAYQLLSLPLLVLAPALTNFLLPLLARSRSEPERARRHVRRTLRLFLAAALPVSVWIALGPADLLAFVLGEEWRPVTGILMALSPLFMVQIVAVVSMVTLVAAERSRTARRFAFWNLGLTIAAVLATAPFGVLAMALGLSISGLLVRAPLVVRYALREGTMERRELGEALRFIALLILGAGALLGLCQLAPVPPLVAQMAGLAVAAAISGGVLFHLMRGRAAQPEA
jgi:PST family polysaccharide transporter